MSSAKPASDAGMDSDLGSYIHGGTVIALGSTMDWAESDSRQVTMNLQFDRQQNADSTISIKKEDGTEVFSCTVDTHDRGFSGMILSTPALMQGETYHVWLDGVLQQYTGNDVGMGFGGRGGMGGMQPGQRPKDFDPEKLPEGMPFPDGEKPEGGIEGFGSLRPEGMERPELPDGETFPEGEISRMIGNDFGGRSNGTAPGEPSTAFYMNDKVNAFSGVTAVSE